MRAKYVELDSLEFATRALSRHPLKRLSIYVVAFDRVDGDSKEQTLEVLAYNENEALVLTSMRIAGHSHRPDRLYVKQVISSK